MDLRPQPFPRKPGAIRKQAEDLLEAFGPGDWQAIGVIHNNHPRFPAGQAKAPAHCLYYRVTSRWDIHDKDALSVKLLGSPSLRGRPGVLPRFRSHGGMARDGRELFAARRCRKRCGWMFLSRS